jgi:cob(I)alamin adenosyltransferase
MNGILSSEHDGMVKLSRIYTRTGDDGATQLGNGARVNKHSLRVNAYGALDEANSAIGVSRLYTTAPDHAASDNMLGRIQNDLFDLGADLCTPLPPDEAPGQVLRVGQDQISRLEREIDETNAHLAPLESFILPGGSSAAAYLHLARCVVRRAERDISALAEVESINPLSLIYTNRLSDHLFVLARYLNNLSGNDVLWVPGAHRGQ